MAVLVVRSLISESPSKVLAKNAGVVQYPLPLFRGFAIRLFTFGNTSRLLVAESVWAAPRACRLCHAEARRVKPATSTGD